MTTAEITRIALELGARALAIEIWLESDPDAPEVRVQSARENRIVMLRAEKAIHQLLKRQDHLSAYIWQSSKEVEYTRSLIKDIIQYER
mgnify:CR=1 FL=1